MERVALAELSKMRAVPVLYVLLAAAATSLCAGMALAETAPSYIAGMAIRPETMQFQALAVEWLRATIGSAQFIFGAVVGITFAEVGRRILRWAMRTLVFLNGTIQFLMRNRLMLCAIAVALGYALTHWGIA